MSDCEVPATDVNSDSAVTISRRDSAGLARTLGSNVSDWTVGTPNRKGQKRRMVGIRV